MRFNAGFDLFDLILYWWSTQVFTSLTSSLTESQNNRIWPLWSYPLLKVNLYFFPHPLLKANFYVYLILYWRSNQVWTYWSYPLLMVNSCASPLTLFSTEGQIKVCPLTLFSTEGKKLRFWSLWPHLLLTSNSGFNPFLLILYWKALVLSSFCKIFNIKIPNYFVVITLQKSPLLLSFSSPIKVWESRALSWDFIGHIAAISDYLLRMLARKIYSYVKESSSKWNFCYSLIL